MLIPFGFYPTPVREKSLKEISDGVNVPRSLGAKAFKKDKARKNKAKNSRRNNRDK